MTSHTIDDLCVMLASPDPAVRDETAYRQFTRRIGAGEADGDLRRLGDRMTDRLGHPEIQARTFATLGLATVLLRAEATRELDADTVSRWRAAFAAWWSAETDLRGYDDGLGWLHAVAHGADTVEAFGRSPYLAAPDLAELLDLVGRRLLTPTGYLFAQAEDDRVSYALAIVLSRPELTADQATAWLTPIRDAFAAGVPGPIPAWAPNTTRTLNALYVAIHRGVRYYVPRGQERPAPTVAPHSAVILDAIADCLREADDYLG